MKKYKPNYLLDEQIYLDGTNTLLFQIREEAKETNRLLGKLVEQNEKQSAEKVETVQEEKVEKKPSKKPQSPEKDDA